MGETRKLPAIMAVDVVGYSRLIGADEAGTVGAVRERRKAAAPIVASLGGRVVKTMGDGVLLEFPSVVAAVECAVAIQNMMVERNVDTPEARRIVYRIGVHLGDVLIDGDDILGEGVNIAARLESICEPGGVSISRAVYDQISGKLALGFRTLGLQKLKNIAKAVEVFAIDCVDKTDDSPKPDDANVAQTIKYCRAPDGVRLA
jgi:class 3 adenylate cyclase